MKVNFRFPILHESCDNCESRFECMTMRIHKEFDSGTYITEIIPFRFDLACFKLEPYKCISKLKLHLLPDEKSMVLEALVVR